MKRMFFLCFFLILSIDVFCQYYRAEKKNTSALIVTQYSRCEEATGRYSFNEGRYAFVRREIVMNDSTYYFFNCRGNHIIQENKYLLKDLGGDIDDYAPVFYFAKEHSIENDLSICPFDSTYYVLDNLAFNVYAKNGFFKRNDSLNNIYAVYYFEGEVILYYWEGPAPDDDEVTNKKNVLEISDDCGCPEHVGPNKYLPFVTLQKTECVFPYFSEETVEVIYQPASVNFIELMYCE